LHFLLCGRGKLEEFGDMNRYVGHNGGGKSKHWGGSYFSGQLQQIAGGKVIQ
jgi:hypothetical protein